MIGVDYAPDPWNEIIPGLFVGGHDYRDPYGMVVDAIVGAEFDLVLSLFRRRGCDYGPAEGVEHHYLNIPDGGLTDDELAELRTLADRAAYVIRGGKRVLSRCQAGYNRSSLLAAFVLLRLGHGADEAVALIREKRSPHALFNTNFQRYILDEAKAVSA